MTRTALLAVLAAGLLTFVPSAHAAITLTQTDDAVVVIGDAGAQHIQIADGDTSGGNNYAFQFYSEDNEPIDLGDSGCASNNGTPVETIFCGTGTFNQAAFLLGAGNDTVEWYLDPQFDTLGALGIDFGAGNDSNESGIRGTFTELAGGAGDDDLAGHDGPTSIVEGGAGNDRIVGGGNLTGETLRGGDGDDNILGLGGNDQIFGEAGNDALVGGAGGDTINGGAGQDNAEGDGGPNAFSGNDTLALGDGERDVGVCGFGADTVTGDSIDLLPAQDCESVTLSGGATTPPPGGGTTPPPPSNAKVALAKPARLSARKRRLAVRVSCPAEASGSCMGQVRFTARFTERGKKRKLSLGRVSFVIQPGASKLVGRKLSKKIVRRLRKAKKRKLTVRAVSRDAAGTEFTSSRTAALSVGR